MKRIHLLTVAFWSACLGALHVADRVLVEGGRSLAEIGREASAGLRREDIGRDVSGPDRATDPKTRN